MARETCQVQCSSANVFDRSSTHFFAFLELTGITVLDELKSSFIDFD